MSEVQRLALVRVLTPRIAALELDAVRLIDHVVTRLELGRERYGDLDLAAPRDWSKELGEELIDALVYQAANVLAAQDLARASLREAARREMVGEPTPLFERAHVRFEHPGYNGVADLGPADPASAAPMTAPAAAFAELFNRECDAAIASADRREAELDAHGYGRPPSDPGFAADAHLTRVSTEPARIAASHEAGGEPYEELELGGEGG